MRPLLLLSVFLCLLRPSFAAEPPIAPMLRIEAGMHTAMINRIATDAAGRVVLTCSDDKTARLWSLPAATADGTRPPATLLRTFRIPLGAGDEGKLYACALSPDGSTAALGGWTGREWDQSRCVYLFDTASGHLLRRLTGLLNVVHDLSFSASGRAIAAGLGGKNGIRVWEVASGQLVGQDSDYGDSCYGLDWQGDGTLASTCDDGYLRLYSMTKLAGASPSLQPAGLTPLRKARSTLGQQPYTIRFSPDGQSVAVGFYDSRAVAVLATEDLRHLYQPDATGVTNGNLGRVAWSADGRSLFAGGLWDIGGPNPIRIWPQAGRGKPQDLQVGATSTLMALRPLPGGGLLFAAADPAWGVVQKSQTTTPGAGTQESGWKGVLMGQPPIADHRTTGAVIHLSADASVVAFSYQSFGKIPATFSLSERRLTPGTPQATLRAPRQEGLPVSNWEDKTAPTLSGQPLKLENFERSRSFAIAPDASFFVLGTGFYLRCYAADGKERWQQSVPGTAWAVNLSADGRIAVTAYGDGTIRWHRADSGKELLAFFPHVDRKRWVLWTPEGYYDCSAGGEELIGWHVNRGKDREADFFPAAKFHDAFYRPDVVSEVLRTLDVGEAVKLANANRPAAQAAPLNAAEVITRMAPPVVELGTGGAAAEIEIPAEAESATLRYRVRGGRTEPVKLVSVRVDGRPVQASAPVPGDEDSFVEAKVPLPLKDCVVAVLAENRYAVSEPALLRVRRQTVAAAPSARPAVEKKGRLFILGIGVSMLKNQAALTGLDQLEYADDDATVFTTTLAKQTQLYRRIEKRLLTNEAATAGDILDALDWLKSSTKPEDTTMILLAGHGESDEQGRYTFCAHDYDRARRLRTGVGFEDIKLALGATKGEVVLFLDACSAGNSLGAGSKVDVTGLVNQLSDSESNIVVFAGSDGHSASFESDALKQGIFTHCIKTGLEGKADVLRNGKITLSGLQTYVDDAVRKLSNGQQVPVINIPKMVPNMTLGLTP
ncbi:hypothetical protein [Prosthecobacter sp.]|uniref:hypothetical protein n=1 Tax=Prosthecobacter sp. TaxID=1965333 RepID=UPI003783EEB2